MAKAMADDDGYFPKPRSSGCPERSAKGRLLNAGYGGMNIGRNSTCFFWGGDCPSEMQPATKIPPPGRRGEKSAATMRPRFRSRDLFFKLRGDQKTAAFFFPLFVRDPGFRPRNLPPPVPSRHSSSWCSPCLSSSWCAPRHSSRWRAPRHSRNVAPDLKKYRLSLCGDGATSCTGMLGAASRPC